MVILPASNLINFNLLENSESDEDSDFESDDDSFDTDSNESDYFSEEEKEIIFFANKTSILAKSNSKPFELPRIAGGLDNAINTSSFRSKSKCCI